MNNVLLNDAFSNVSYFKYIKEIFRCRGTSIKNININYIHNCFLYIEKYKEGMSLLRLLSSVCLDLYCSDAESYII